MSIVLAEKAVSEVSEDKVEKAVLEASEDSTGVARQQKGRDCGTAGVETGE